MAKFKVAAGKHHQRQADGSEKTFNQGDQLEMSASEAAKFPNKFIPVIEDESEAEAEVSAKSALVPATKPGPVATKPAAK